jgi:DNA-binding transcriptional ArsR family regulator
MDEIEELAETFKALSDPTRLRLVRLLSERASGNHTPDECGGGPLCVNALARKLGITQSAVSQHLRILRQTGLVRGERRGSFVHYSLDSGGLDKYRAALREALGEGFITV